MSLGFLGRGNSDIIWPEFTEVFGMLSHGNCLYHLRADAKTGKWNGSGTVTATSAVLREKFSCCMETAVFLNG